MFVNFDGSQNGDPCSLCIEEFYREEISCNKILFNDMLTDF